MYMVYPTFCSGKPLNNSSYVLSCVGPEKLKADHSGILTILDRWKTTVVDGPPIGWYLHHSVFLLPTSGLETPKLGNWRASIWRNERFTVTFCTGKYNGEYVWANFFRPQPRSPQMISWGDPPHPNPLSSGLGMIVICPDMWYILFKSGTLFRWVSIVVVTSHHSHNTWDPEWCDSRPPCHEKERYHPESSPDFEFELIQHTLR